MVTDVVRARVCEGAIVECAQAELAPGKLGQRFQSGTKAVLMEDPRAAHIWHSLLSPQTSPAPTADGSSTPWNSSVFQMAQNHLAGNLDAGDMLRFIPGGIGHVARKVVLVPAADGSISTIPTHFSNDTIPQELLHTVWELMTDVLSSTFPAQSHLPPYAVTIEILTYPFSFDEVEQIATLLSDAGGPWTRLGLQMDTWKAQAAGFFAIRYLREFLALASVVPGLHGLLRTLNTWMIPFSCKHVPGATRLIGDPHIDGSKIVTVLLSERQTLTTEIYTGQEWVELPLTSDRLAIFPSRQIDSDLGILPTLHRVLIQKDHSFEQSDKPNMTVCFTALPRS